MSTAIRTSAFSFVGTFFLLFYFFFFFFELNSFLWYYFFKFIFISWRLITLLWELSMTFYIFHRHSICLVNHVDLICSLYSWWEGLGSSSLATLPRVSIVVLFPPLHVGHPLGFAPEASLEDLGLPL